jgi:thiosulfate dehydrogenase [quinone] large subunit
MEFKKELQIALGILRLAVGFIFLWAFFDKLLGLGFSTCFDPQTKTINYFCNQAWIKGGSPTFGFLKFATKGPFAGIFPGYGRKPIG